MLRIVGISLLLALPAQADVAEAVDSALAGHADFSAATARLDEAAQGSCDPAVLRPAYNAAFDAWMAVSHLRLGPVEDKGRALAIAFWPDPKGQGQKAVAALLAAADPALADPDRFAEVSVAARGLFGLERMLYIEPPGEYPCLLVRAMASDLARMAAETEAGWTGGFAAVLTTAGTAGNTTYLSRTEARQALFTQLVAGLGFTADERLGRPLGTFERPRPERAEARASGRSLQNVRLSLAALRGLALALVPDSPQTQAALDRAIRLAAALDDPVFDGVADPQGRLKVEILYQAVEAAEDAVEAEIGPALEVGIGFNAGDGD